MSASDYTEQKVLDHIFNLAAWTVPANLYIGLFTAAPNDAGGGTEVVGNAYARVQVTNSSSTWSRSGSTISNGVAITFAAPSPGTWGTVTHYGIFDASTSGNLIFWSALSSATTTSVGVALSFSGGTLTTTAD